MLSPDIAARLIDLDAERAAQVAQIEDWEGEAYSPDVSPEDVMYDVKQGTEKLNAYLAREAARLRRRAIIAHLGDAAWSAADAKWLGRCEAVYATAHKQTNMAMRGEQLKGKLLKWWSGVSSRRNMRQAIRKWKSRKVE